ncbi:SpoIIE family protein phosphatase/ATP-binding protein [Streptomyces sp. KM77-8]|uniref:SpoIIE family protein phosphatase/ATP-binding protein n=1 Tax=Streptomyces haneummycinicus TaxID=3074435 RepID=A0AAT9HL34_9ACTN
MQPVGRLRSLLRAHSVAGQAFVLQALVVTLIITTALVALVFQARRDSTHEAQTRSLAVATTFASSPQTLSALTGPNPSKVLRPLSEQIRPATDVDPVVVHSSDGTRYAHPAGSVAVGITGHKVAGMAAQQFPVVLGIGGVALAVCAGGTALVSRRLLRQTHGLDPVERTRMYDHHDAVLHAVREGVLIVEGDGQLVLANDEARRLLDLPPDAEGRKVTDLSLSPDITELLTSERTATDELLLSADWLLAVSKRRTEPGDGNAGSVVTLRDTTELRALSGRAEASRERLSLLYDAGARIGSSLNVERTAHELARVAVPRFADLVTVDLAEEVLHGEEPTRRHTVMQRAGLSTIHDGLPLMAVGETVRFPDATPQARCVKSGRAVLEADLSAAEGWRTLAPDRAEELLGHGFHSLIAVPLRARGTVLGSVDFWRSERADPYDESDVLFAEELSAWAAVALDNARRYTREHAMAVTLQRSLLPRDLPDLSALEAAYRYLPAQAGVGGDWFDVIELSGARVALVVGDVVGHGMHAAATMGRLRTAVHNFATLDLSPDELLARVDDLVARLDRERADQGDDEGIIGATCLYVVYDPASGTCSAARAGHPPPALVRPDGTVTFPDMPAGPLLGLGDLPFESTEFEVPEEAGWSSTPTGSSRAATGTSTPVWRSCAARCPTPAGRPRRPATRCSTPSCRTAGTTTSPCWSRGPGCSTPSGSPTGTCPRSRRRGRRPRRRHPAAGGVGSDGRGLHDRAHPQRTGHQRHPLRHRPDPRPPAAGPPPDLRGVRRQQHLAAPAPGDGHGRGRTRPVPRRPLRRTLGHPVHAHRQGDLGRAATGRQGERTRRRPDR